MPFLSKTWQKVAINGNDINENGSKYSKPSYFEIVEVVKHFGLERSRRSVYVQIAKIAKKSHLKIRRRKKTHFGLCFVCKPILIHIGWKIPSKRSTFTFKKMVIFMELKKIYMSKPVKFYSKYLILAYILIKWPKKNKKNAFFPSDFIGNRPYSLHLSPMLSLKLWAFQKSPKSLQAHIILILTSRAFQPCMTHRAKKMP